MELTCCQNDIKSFLRFGATDGNSNLKLNRDGARFLHNLCKIFSTNLLFLE